LLCPPDEEGLEHNSQLGEQKAKVQPPALPPFQSPGVFKCQQRPRMPKTQHTGLHPVLHVDLVASTNAGSSIPSPGLCRCAAPSAPESCGTPRQPLKRPRLLHGIQIGPLQVLDDGDLHRLLVRHLPQNRRDRLLPRQLRCLQRRSPAISWNRPFACGRTRIGCTTPFAAIEAASSASVSSLIRPASETDCGRSVPWGFPVACRPHSRQQGSGQDSYGAAKSRALCPMRVVCCQWLRWSFNVFLKKSAQMRPVNLKSRFDQEFDNCRSDSGWETSRMPLRVRPETNLSHRPG
jgi:hypothetical protein